MMYTQGNKSDANEVYFSRHNEHTDLKLDLMHYISAVQTMKAFRDGLELVSLQQNMHRNMFIFTLSII